MKNVKFMLESLPEDKQQFVNISNSKNLLGGANNKMTLYMKTKKDAGLDAVDILAMAKYLVQHVDSIAPDADHKATILNIEEAQFFQDRFKRNEAKKV